MELPQRLRTSQRRTTQRGLSLRSFHESESPVRRLHRVKLSREMTKCADGWFETGELIKGDDDDGLVLPA